MARIMVPQMRFIYDETLSLGGDCEDRNRKSLKSLEDAFQSDIKRTIASAVNDKIYFDRTILLQLGEFQSSGLLLTADGWIATNSHCIEHILPELNTIIESRKKGDLIKRHKKFSVDISNYSALINNENYPIDFRYHAIDRDHDIALIKARGSRLCEDMILPWKESKASLIIPNRTNYSQIQLGDGIRIYSRKESLRSMSAGTITNMSKDSVIEEKKITYLDTIGTDFYAMYGYSGGVVTSVEHEVLGFVTCITTHQGDSESGHANITKVDYLIELIDFYVKNAAQIINVETEKEMAQLPKIAYLFYDIE